MQTFFTPIIFSRYIEPKSQEYIRNLSISNQSFCSTFKWNFLYAKQIYFSIESFLRVLKQITKLSGNFETKSLPYGFVLCQDALWSVTEIHTNLEDVFQPSLYQLVWINVTKLLLFKFLMFQWNVHVELKCSKMSRFQHSVDAPAKFLPLPFSLCSKDL